MTDYVYPKKPEEDPHGLKEDRGWSQESYRTYMKRKLSEEDTLKKGSYEYEYGKASDKQVGGNHYKDVAISSIDYIVKNKLNFCEGNIIKYISRHKRKNGAEDIKKAIHYAELILELEYGKDD
tara:strand:- start:324 stop:692 length:369 start_codon:yes stop_codon:yes gene_type:complete